MASKAPRPSGCGAERWCASLVSPQPDSAQSAGTPPRLGSVESKKRAPPSPRCRPRRPAERGAERTPLCAPSAWKPASVKGLRTSMPPARAYRTSPVRSRLAASQRALPDAVQAVETVRSGPEAPIERASCEESFPSSSGARIPSSEAPAFTAASASLSPEVAFPRITQSEASTSSRTEASSPERISSAASRTSRKPRVAGAGEVSAPQRRDKVSKSTSDRPGASETGVAGKGAGSARRASVRSGSEPSALRSARR